MLGKLPSVHASATYLILRCASLIPINVSATLIVGLGAAGQSQTRRLYARRHQPVHIPLLVILALGWLTHHPYGIAGRGHLDARLGDDRGDLRADLRRAQTDLSHLCPAQHRSARLRCVARGSACPRASSALRSSRPTSRSSRCWRRSARRSSRRFARSTSFRISPSSCRSRCKGDANGDRSAHRRGRSTRRARLSAQARCARRSWSRRSPARWSRSLPGRSPSSSR